MSSHLHMCFAFFRYWQLVCLASVVLPMVASQEVARLPADVVEAVTYAPLQEALTTIAGSSAHPYYGKDEPLLWAMRQPVRHRRTLLRYLLFHGVGKRKMWYQWHATPSKLFAAAIAADDLPLLKRFLKSGLHYEVSALVPLAIRYNRPAIVAWLLKRDYYEHATLYGEQWYNVSLLQLVGLVGVGYLMRQMHSDYNLLIELSRAYIRPSFLASALLPYGLALLLYGGARDTLHRMLSLDNGSYNITYVHMAARWGHQEVLEYLAKHGAVLDAHATIWLSKSLLATHTTPLHLALRHGHEQVALFLLAQGASPSQVQELWHYPTNHQVTLAKNKHFAVTTSTSWFPRHLCKVPPLSLATPGGAVCRALHTYLANEDGQQA